MSELPLDFDQHPRNVQYTATVARLLNQSETGVARALANESDNFLERQYGRLLVTVDLNFTSDSYDISEVIADSMAAEFYGDLNRSVAEAFEHALTATNQTLADLAAEGQNDWVGKLNAVVAVLHENELHISKVGNAEAYLVRGSSITHVTEGLATRAGDGATAKTFLNIAGGQLEVGDKLILATGELFNHLALTDIRRHLYLHHPPKAIRKMADALIEDTAVNRLAVVVAELTTIDLISAEISEDEPDEIILSASRKHFEKLQGFKPFRKDTPAAEYADKAKKYYDRRVRPRMQRGVATARHRLASFQAKRRGEVPPPPPRAAAGTPETTRPTQSRNRTQYLAPKSGETVKKLAAAIAPVTAALRTGWQQTAGRTAVGRKIDNRANQFFRRVRSLPLEHQLRGSRKIIYRNALIAVAVIFALSLYLSVSADQTRRAEARVRDKITKVEATQAKADTSFIAKDFDGARRQLSDAKTQADALAKEKVLKNETRALQERINNSFDRINNVIVFSNPAITDFRNADGRTVPNVLTQSGVGLYAMAESGALLVYDGNSKTTRVANPGAVSGSRVKSMATTSNGDVLILTDKPQILQFDTSANSVTDVPVGVGGALEPGVAIDTVQQNVFILEPAKNQVWRHTRSLAEFNRGDPYLTSTVDLKNAVDLVSGSQVFVLGSDGSVIQLTGGSVQDFKVAGLPGPNDKVTAVALAVNFTTNAVYVADPKGNRVIEYSGTGAYVRQFKSDAFGKITDIAVDEKSNNLNVLSDGKLYTVSLAGQ